MKCLKFNALPLRKPCFLCLQIGSLKLPRVFSGNQFEILVEIGKSVESTLKTDLGDGKIGALNQ